MGSAVPKSIVVSLVLLLAGCATTTPLPETDHAAAEKAFATRQALLSGWTGFTLTGRVAAKGAGLSGRLRWQQDGDRYQIRVAGPFGAGAMSIEGTPAEALIQSKDLSLTTDTPEATLAARTGWPLPLMALSWWVRGLPAPGDDLAMTPSLTLDAAGQPQSLAQSGWALSFSDYHGAQPSLPHRIVGRRGEAELIVVVESLTPQGAEPAP